MKQKVVQSESCDVYVAGAGIAGITAAIEAAASHGSKVILSGSTEMFSGSSFYPGTWGLGMVSPENERDEEDFIQTILKVGCDMANEDMVRTFVRGMRPVLQWLQELGVTFMTAKEKGQKDFIPCFDHKHRQWNGIVAKDAKKTFEKILKERNVIQRPFHRLVDIRLDKGRVCGVIVENGEQQLEYISCGALVLATGGYGGLYQNRLTTSDIQGTGQYLALRCGATLVNMEYMQMMAGFVSPCTQTIFNERTFRYAKFQVPCEQETLEQRSTYGPFTSRFRSRDVDFLIHEAGEQGLCVTYKDTLKNRMPEFIQTYFTWLKEAKGLTAQDQIHIAMFAHAANGGIKIDEWGGTGVPGMFACGEVTGGMHGADRIGGLSTMNGFVFGRRTGQTAVQYSRSVKSTVGAHTEEIPDLWTVEDIPQCEEALQAVMNQYAFLVRNKNGLETGMRMLKNMQKSMTRHETNQVHEAVRAWNLCGRIQLALGIMKAQMLRQESRGSHYREDYPIENPKEGHRILIYKDGEQIHAAWEEE